jgi:hypothetical protein
MKVVVVSKVSAALKVLDLLNSESIMIALSIIVPNSMGPTPCCRSSYSASRSGQCKSRRGTHEQSSLG